MSRAFRVKSVKDTGETAPVYNLEVDGTHNFILSNGIVVHNCYDSLGYLLISRHAEKSKQEKNEETAPLRLHKQRVVQSSKRRRYL